MKKYNSLLDREQQENVEVNKEVIIKRHGTFYNNIRHMCIIMNMCIIFNIVVILGGTFDGQDFGYT